MPTRDTPWPDGTPCWVDYGAADMDATKSFYTELLGWEYTGGEPEFGGYLTATRNGRQAAGLGPQQDPNDPPRWTTYFATRDAAATATRIREAGGTVLMEPMEVGPMGTMVIALDPGGNPFGLWQAGMHTGVRIYNEPGSLTWNEAAVEDADAARSFYSAVFGYRWDEVPGAVGYMTFRTDDRGQEYPLGGLGGLQPGAPQGWQACFAVASTDKAVDVVGSAGGTVLTPPMDTPFGRFAVVRDPWGASLELMQSPQA
jgi:predicted enzyme related to lactoylglutathione lyase